jgi:hypothetical protein
MTNTGSNWLYTAAALVLLATATPMTGAAYARDGVRQDFTATTSSGSGRVRFTLRSDADGRLEIRVHALAPDASFDVLVGSVRVGTLRTTGGGNGTLRFRSRPRGRDLPLGFDPRGALITIRDAQGTDVLVTTVPAARGDSASSVACCRADDDGSAECEQRSADACTASGGVPAAAASCLPNPCAATPPEQQSTVCCVPDDGGAECEDRTTADCAVRGGVVVAATSCEPNPCAPIAPADSEIQCCVPHDAGAECEDRTPVQCAAVGGTNMGPGSCAPDPCQVQTTVTPTAGDERGGDDAGGRHGGGRGESGGTYYGVPISTGASRGDSH